MYFMQKFSSCNSAFIQTHCNLGFTHFKSQPKWKAMCVPVCPGFGRTRRCSRWPVHQTAGCRAAPYTTWRSPTESLQMPTHHSLLWTSPRKHTHVSRNAPIEQRKTAAADRCLQPIVKSKQIALEQFIHYRLKVCAFESRLLCSLQLQITVFHCTMS